MPEVQRDRKVSLRKHRHMEIEAGDCRGQGHDLGHLQHVLGDRGHQQSRTRSNEGLPRKKEWGVNDLDSYRVISDCVRVPVLGSLEAPMSRLVYAADTGD